MRQAEACTIPAIDPQAALADLLAQSIDDPAFFILEVLQPVDLGPRWKWQKRVCDQIRDQLHAGKRHLKVLIRSCHGAGKTWLAAALTTWWTTTRPNARTLTLAPTWSGVENHIWPNIAKLFNGSLLREWGKMLDTSLELDEPASGGKSTWYAIGASSDRPEHLEGHHSPTAAMRVVDEAKAVEKPIFVATEGMLDAPETLDLWISTPSIADGEFYKRDVGSEKAIRYMVDVDELIRDGVEEKRAWKQDLLEKWGEEDPDYQSRVLARYVDNAHGMMFPSSWVERAMEQTFDVAKPLVGGVDVAGSVDGDENAVAIAAGPDAQDHVHVRSIESWKERNTMRSKGRALSIARPLSAPLTVDVIGLGKGVADALREDKYPVTEYRSSDRPRDPSRFVNRKAEDAWMVRRLLERGLTRWPKSQQLKAQAVAIRYEVLSNGKIHVIDPSDSPDLVDAVIIAISRLGRGTGFFAAAADEDEPGSRLVTKRSLGAF